MSIKIIKFSKAWKENFHHCSICGCFLQISSYFRKERHFERHRFHVQSSRQRVPIEMKIDLFSLDSYFETIECSKQTTIPWLQKPNFKNIGLNYLAVNKTRVFFNVQLVSQRKELLLWPCLGIKNILDFRCTRTSLLTNFNICKK